MVLWPGFCIVHEQFNARRLAKMRAEYPNAPLIAHPECEEAVLEHADFIGSTLALLKYVQTHPEQKQFIVATEVGILHQMEKVAARRRVLLLPAQLRLQLRHVPVYAAEHAGKALPLHARPAPGDHDGRGNPRPRPAARPADARHEQKSHARPAEGRLDRLTSMPDTPLFGAAIKTPVGPLLGAHMPTAGGHACALTGGHAIGCQAVQIFTASPRQWRSPAIKDETRDAWRKALAECGITKTVAHDRI